jgi:hypothetical protein
MSFKQRFRFVVEFTGDLDMVPGAMHQVEDWHHMATQRIDAQTHYNTSSRVLFSNPVLGPYADPEIDKQHAEMRAALAFFRGLDRSNIEHPTIHSTRVVGFKVPYAGINSSNEVLHLPLDHLRQLLKLAELGETLLNAEVQSCPEDVGSSYVGGFCSTAGAPPRKPDLSDTGPYATTEDEEIANDAGQSIEELRLSRYQDDLIGRKE